jgi:hypothetical protein
VLFHGLKKRPIFSTLSNGGGPMLTSPRAVLVSFAARAFFQNIGIAHLVSLLKDDSKITKRWPI